MIVKSVTLYVKEENINEFIEATLENQRNSRKEKGIECFDFFQCEDDATKFLLHEIYSSQEAMDEHLKTEHFKRWINAVEEHFSKPRERVTYVEVS
jgi:autoinducer 2-degrading protein